MISGFFDDDLDKVVSPLFGLNYWVGFSMALIIIASLFIFKKFYAKVSWTNYFRYFLGSLQILLFFLYYLFHGLSGALAWKDYMPFHLSALLDLTSAFVLLFPSEIVFSMTLPLIGPAILPFLITDNETRVFGLDNFFFYRYYLHHIIILFGYSYLYFYGHIKYNKDLLAQTCSFMSVFALFVFIFNISFDTNFLYIGAEGISLSDTIWILDTGNWNPILRFLLMWSIGVGFVTLFHFLLVRLLPPFYFNHGAEINEFYNKRKSVFSKIKQWLDKNKKDQLVESN